MRYLLKSTRWILLLNALRLVKLTVLQCVTKFFTLHHICKFTHLLTYFLKVGLVRLSRAELWCYTRQCAIWTDISDLPCNMVISELRRVIVGLLESDPCTMFDIDILHAMHGDSTTSQCYIALGSRMRTDRQTDRLQSSVCRRRSSLHKIWQMTLYKVRSIAWQRANLCAIVLLMTVNVVQRTVYTVTQ